METKCPYVEKCPIYAQFRTDTSREAVVALFCAKDFDCCERKKMRDKGETPPEKLLPDGQYLP